MAGFGKPIPREESIGALRGRATEAAPSSEPQSGEQGRGSDKDALEKLKERFQPRAPAYSLEDVVLSATTTREVASVLAKVEHHEVLYREWQLSRLDGSAKRLVFNLYGPPGTGKTMLAEALAKRFGKNVIEVSYAEIESKYVGDTPKNIVAAFSAAESHDAVLFFDEADSILGRRMTNVTQAADHGVNVSRAVMLKQLDRFAGVVMFATNLARNFDSAFVRRILYHISIDAPDHEARERLWRQMVPEAMPGRGVLEFKELATGSEGLVGGELKNAIILAATEAVQRKGEHRRVTMDDLKRSIDIVRRAKRDVGAAERGLQLPVVDAA